MSALPNTRPMTLDDLELLPDIDGIQELLDGELVQMPPPKDRPSQICSKILEKFYSFLTASRIRCEAGFVIQSHFVQPDVSVSFPNQPTERGWLAGAPMVAIEVASRGNTPNQLEWKKDLYLANGAQEVWIVYDKTQTIVVHQADGHSIRYTDHFVSHALNTEMSAKEVFAVQA